MDERLRFVARLLEGEKTAPLCAEFGISRKTGYKFFERYKDCGLTALTDRSRRPYRHPTAVWTAQLREAFPNDEAPRLEAPLNAFSCTIATPHLPRSAQPSRAWAFRTCERLHARRGSTRSRNA